MKEWQRVSFAVLAGELPVGILIAASFILGYERMSIENAFFILSYSLIPFVHIVVFGVPAYIWLRKLNKLNWTNVIIISALVSQVIPCALFIYAVISKNIRTVVSDFDEIWSILLVLLVFGVVSGCSVYATWKALGKRVVNNG